MYRGGAEEALATAVKDQIATVPGLWQNLRGLNRAIRQAADAAVSKVVLHVKDGAHTPDVARLVRGCTCVEELSVVDERTDRPPPLEVLPDGARPSLKVISWTGSIGRLAPLALQADSLRHVRLECSCGVSLDGLGACRLLVSLSMRGLRTADLAPISGLTSLKHLTMESMQNAADIGPLAGLRSLEKVRLASCGVSSLVPLSGLRALACLTLEGCPNLTSLELIGDLPALKHLIVSCSGSTGSDPRAVPPPLGRLPPSLVHLTILSSRSLVQDVSSLSAVSSLRTLSLRGSHIGGMNLLTNLRVLDLSQSSHPASSTRTEHLSALVKLKALDLSGVDVRGDFAALGRLRDLVALTVDVAENAQRLDSLHGCTSLAKLYLCIRGTVTTPLMDVLQPLGGIPSLRLLSFRHCTRMDSWYEAGVKDIVGPGCRVLFR